LARTLLLLLYLDSIACHVNGGYVTSHVLVLLRLEDQVLGRWQSTLAGQRFDASEQRVRKYLKGFQRLHLLHYFQAITDQLAEVQERVALYCHIGLNLGISKMFAKALRLNGFSESAKKWSTVGAGVPAAAEVSSCVRVWSPALLRTACRRSEHVEQASQIPPRCMN
jgi:hypothetical protein